MTDLFAFLTSIHPIWWLYIGLGLFCVIVIRSLYRLYRQTHTLDYIIFAGVFFCFTLYILPTRLLSYSNILIFWQLRHTSLNLTHMLMFIHSLRVYLEKYQKELTIIGISWFIILQILILFWQLMPEEPETVLFWNTNPHSMRPKDQPSTFGAGIKINDILLYSTGHPFIAYCYYTFVAATFLYSYYSAKPANPTPRIILARKIWLVTALLFLVATSLLLIYPFSFTVEVVALTVGIFLVLIAYTALKLPESLFITYAQLFRALSLYKEVQKKSMDISPNVFGMENVIEYLRNLPPEIQSQLKLE